MTGKKKTAKKEEVSETVNEPVAEPIAEPIPEKTTKAPKEKFSVAKIKQEITKTLNGQNDYSIVQGTMRAILDKHGISLQEWQEASRKEKQK